MVSPDFSDTPFIEYASLNWYEHMELASHVPMGICTTNSQEKPAMFDISKPQFWTWFSIAGRRIRQPTLDEGEPIAQAWATAIDLCDCDYGRFLRDMCLRKLGHMDDKVAALLGSAASPSDTE
jgi:hypothetical protein